ncbi:MAG: HAD family hydrolase [Deltaproteobacteria bacterium]|nr:HAD family hydrolase [Deltaproteobacteria bacterium]
MPRYKLCYFDVDETLVDETARLAGQLLPELDAALRACGQRGIRLGLATGRMLEAARPYADLVGASAPLILYNGARIQDAESGEVLFGLELEPEETRRALRLARKHGLHVNFYQDEEILIEAESEAARSSARKDGVQQRLVRDLDAAVRADRGPTKLLCIGPGERLEALKTDFDSKPHLAELVRSEPTYMEVLPHGVSKGAALSRVAAMLEVPPESIAAFGDSNNDIEMLEYAGLGVAVANALDAVKRASDLVAPRPNGTGVADVLRAHVLARD